MSNFLKNGNLIISENQLSQLLGKFETDFIYQIIQDNINNKFGNYFSVIPNIVASFESNFKEMENAYPFGLEEINDVRDKTYVEIINILCRNYNIQFNSDIDTDSYSAAYSLYKFLVSEFRQNIVYFFANFIYKERNNLYESLQLARFKKSKDSGTIYNKKVFKNQKIGIIITNLNYVLESIFNFDIPFEVYLNYCSANKNYNSYLQSIMLSRDDFFKDHIVKSLKENDNTRSILMMDIRIEIQKLSQINDINSNLVKEK